jgi:hypothetical protein
MPLQSAIRPEYFDAAIEKAATSAEVEALLELRLLAVALDETEQMTQEQSIANRLAAGEALKRVGAPKSIASASERAANDIHKLESRKCHRAVSAAEIVTSMLQLLDNDIDFWRPALQKIELQSNRLLSEQLLATKLAFREKLSAFLEVWQSAA